jgi:hypothetical protein
MKNILRQPEWFLIWMFVSIFKPKSWLLYRKTDFEEAQLNVINQQ